MTRRLLVTGGAGFIGSNFCRWWSEHHPDDTIVVLDALTYAGVRASLADLDSVEVAVGDIADRSTVEALLQEHRIDTVVNFAAESHNSLAILDPSRFFRTNGWGTQQLLEACRTVGVDRFHHISTCEVYGDLPLDSHDVFTEDSPYLPNTPYNASKAAADHIVRAYHHTFELPITITNCANNYGAYQFPEKVIPLFVTNALDDKPLPVYTSSDNRREWIHVLDHCSAIAAVLDRGAVGRTYHVGTGLERSVIQLADAILATLGKPSSLKTVVPDRPGHDRRYLLDSSRIRAELGWEPAIDFAEGLSTTIEWYAQNRSWWEPLQGRSPVAEATAWTGRDTQFAPHPPPHQGPASSPDAADRHA